MKKIIMIIMLISTAVSCELLNPKEWEKTRQNMKERGHTCERDNKGYWHCYDTK